LTYKLLKSENQSLSRFEVCFPYLFVIYQLLIIRLIPERFDPFTPGWKYAIEHINLAEFKQYSAGQVFNIFLFLTDDERTTKIGPA
jgi:hypothetical protein